MTNRNMLPKLAAKSIEARKRIRLSAAAAGIGVSALLVSGCGYFETKEGSWELEVACSDEDARPTIKSLHRNIFVEFACIDGDDTVSPPDYVRKVRSHYDGQSRDYMPNVNPNVVVEYSYSRAGDITEQTPSMYVSQFDADGELREGTTVYVDNAHIGTITEIDR